MPGSATNFLESLGARAAALRQERHMTQAQVAEKAQLTSKYVSEIERGGVNPSVSVLLSLAHALGTSAATLLAEPGAEDAELALILSGMADGERKRALRVLRALAEPVNAPRKRPGPLRASKKEKIRSW